MNLEERLKEMWGTEAAKEETPPLCPFAESFSQWARELVTKTLTNPSLVSINQAKILLLDKYFAWRVVVPKRHRNINQASSHLCIFDIFCENYERLKVVELSLTPPMLFIPPPPPAPLPPPPPAPPAQITGIF